VIAVDFSENDRAGMAALVPSLDVLVALGRRRLGDIDRIGARKGLFQPLFEGVVEPSLYLPIRRAGLGRSCCARSGHGMSSNREMALKRCDLARHPTMLDDNAVKKFKKGPGRP
jgi:hypothetical protein